MLIAVFLGWFFGLEGWEMYTVVSMVQVVLDERDGCRMERVLVVCLLQPGV